MKKWLISIFGILMMSFPTASPVLAGECFVGSVQMLSGTATLKSGVNLRDHACMEQSSVLVSVPGGSSVKVLGEWDGWYKIEYGGKRGWLYGTFVSNVSASEQGRKDYQEFEAAYPSGNAGASTGSPAQTSTDANLLTRLKGYILLQVQAHGEAWYVDPVSSKRYYMKDGPTAYEMMRSFGLGVSEADYTKIAAGNRTLKERLRGRIILRAQAHGEAYYIHPKDLSVYYLKSGDEAYRVMRLYSLGVTNSDLNQVTGGEIPVIKR